MKLCLVGISHRGAPLELREKLHAPPELSAIEMNRLLAQGTVKEIVEISTCNRVEFVAMIPRASAVEDLVRALALLRGAESSEIARHGYQFEDSEACAHLFQVVSGLDSMVLGEPQINGQVKAAYQNGCDAGTVGSTLHRLFHKAFHVAKRVRTETEVGRHASGIARAAVDLSLRIFEDLTQKQVLLIGTGEMGQLAVRHFREYGVQEVTIASRSLARAQEVAKDLHATPITWESLHEAFAKMDVVVAATDAGATLMGRTMAERVMRARRGRPVFLIDISVPRVFDPEAGQVDGVYLFDVDDLEQVAERGRELRRQAADLANKMIVEEVESYQREQAAQRVSPLVRDLHLGFDAQVSQEVSKSYSRLVHTLGLEDQAAQQALREALQSMGSALRKRWLHAPVGKLKELGRAGQVREIELAIELLGLTADAPDLFSEEEAVEKSS